MQRNSSGLQAAWLGNQVQPDSEFPLFIALLSQSQAENDQAWMHARTSLDLGVYAHVSCFIAELALRMLSSHPSNNAKYYAQDSHQLLPLQNCPSNSASSTLLASIADSALLSLPGVTVFDFIGDPAIFAKSISAPFSGLLSPATSFLSP